MSIRNFYRSFLLDKRVISTDSTTATTYSPAIICQGFIQPVKGNENFKQGRAGEDVTARLYTDISVNAVYGDKVTQDSISYIVLYGGLQVNGISGVGHHKEILLGAYE